MAGCKQLPNHVLRRLTRAAGRFVTNRQQNRLAPARFCPALDQAADFLFLVTPLLGVITSG